MKSVIRICSLMLLAAFVAASINPAACFARKLPKYQEELSTDPKLAEANELYKKAIGYIHRGDGAFYKRPGEAVQLYSNGESYLNDTVFTLKEIAYKSNIDVSKEIAFCEDLRRKTHVKTNKARALARR